MSWQWYEWETLEDFVVWHDIIKNNLGLPRLSIDKYGNPCDPIIEHYTQATNINGKAIAMVENEYATDLTLTNLRPIKQSFDYDENQTF